MSSAGRGSLDLGQSGDAPCRLPQQFPCSRNNSRALASPMRSVSAVEPSTSVKRIVRNAPTAIDSGLDLAHNRGGAVRP